MRNEYLNQAIVEWLASEEAAAIASGRSAEVKPWEERNYEILTSLSLHYAGHSIVNPLTAESRTRLAKLISNPRRSVCAMPECACEKIHVDATATKLPHVVRSISHPGERYYSLLPHKTQPRLLILSDADGMYAMYCVSDPTKSPAWDYSVEVDLAEAKQVCGLRQG